MKQTPTRERCAARIGELVLPAAMPWTVQALTEEEDETLVAPLDGQPEFGRQCDSRTDVDDRAFTCLGELRRDCARKPRESDRVETEEKTFGRARARAVDQHSDASRSRDRGLYLRKFSRVCEVSSKNIDRDPGIAPQAIR